MPGVRGRIVGQEEDRSAGPGQRPGGWARPDESGCPAGYPIQLPELLENVSWGGGTPAYWAGKQLTLTSDGATDAPGATSHADFLQSWDPTALSTMVAQCINVAPSTTSTCG